jgi:hypothetical protein
LNGLDESYAIVIRMLTQKLKEWPPEQLQLPRLLQIDGLHKPIKDMMKDEKELNKPYVQVTWHSQKTTTNPWQPRQEHTGMRLPVGMICHLCHGYGHRHFDCHKMAQFIILQNTYKHWMKS